MITKSQGQKSFVNEEGNLYFPQTPLDHACDKHALSPDVWSWSHASICCCHQLLSRV